MMSDADLKALAGQLRQPHGTMGAEVADMMHATNIGMTIHAIDRLSVAANDLILELGHGSGKHLPYLLQQKEGLTYYGLEISGDMNRLAAAVNKTLAEQGKAVFQLYDGLHLPFEDLYFDRIFTVNTVYFWEEPGLLLAELHRVLKPGGRLNITFAQEHFMQMLPFTKYGFTLYDDEKMEQLIKESPFRLADTASQAEEIESKTGDRVRRAFTTVSLEK
ncbi:class I SAM-dependent methyltransferase [Niabella sp. CC-SYL272]|uniref:class I SAM-dependent methyltransferase n=1 Tax=Niabella agricola TaxID=2891571 RepID=UPI001F471820|nr:class I SAM-dependent methyltransferase [Niabella agricola]MCF3108236.1 class I SAM-dependent methyltransferase [Niabella agricola]